MPPRRERFARKGGLNLSGEYSAAAEKRACETSGEPCGEGSACCAGGDGASTGTWSAFLHALVHPGCTGDHGPGSSEKSPSIPGERAAPDSNLNLSAAMLHLIADCMRGVTILITAIVIQAGVVSDTKRADAVCALLVAAFVALGSVALVHRMFTAFRRELRVWLSSTARSVR